MDDPRFPAPTVAGPAGAVAAAWPAPPSPATASGHTASWGATGNGADGFGSPGHHPRPPEEHPRPSLWRWPTVAMGVTLVVLAAMVASLAVLVDRVQTEGRSVRAAAAAQQRSMTEQLQAAAAATNALNERLGRLETQVGQQPDLAKVAKSVEPSVYTVQTAREVGSGFAFLKSGGITGLITDYHVIKDAWETGNHQVQVRRDNGSTLLGTIQRVDQVDDLALVTVLADLPLLARATNPPLVGDPVLVVGSPLGLGGSATSGIVSAFRGGKLQFSAPVSPGSSGGPVVDRQGHVVGVTQSKLVGDGTEGLGFATTIDVVCRTVTSCG